MLPEQDWLPQAKRLAIGMRTRIKHRQETRSNLVIANERDKWWAYCQRCHSGGVVEKEHVRLTDALITPDVSLVFPQDSMAVRNSEYEENIERFLLSKNMASEYLPPMRFSPSRKRLLVPCWDEWHGRDVTGKSPSKWLNYMNSQVVGRTEVRCTVVVEDLFSMYKTQWALRGTEGVGVLCALGTQDKPELIRRLMEVERTIWFFDADRAGDDGAQRGQLRLRAFGHKQVRLRPPEGKDPKDMDCETIRQEVLRCCY